MFDNCWQKGSKLAQYYFYDYFKLVSIVYNKTGKGILLAKKHPYFPSIIQRLYNTSPYKTLMALFRPLSLNKVDKDTIKRAIQIQTCDKMM